MNSWWITLLLVWRVLKYRPDVVWFNMGFSSLADKPIPAMLALQCPALIRLLGFYSVVTLHTFMEAIDLDDAGVKLKTLYRLGGTMATHSILSANDVCVLLPSYRDILIRKYGADPRRIHAHPHGVFSRQNIDASESESLRVLAFGRWGTYKRLDYLLESFELVVSRVPHAKLILAGSSHPNTPGYFERTVAAWSNRPWLEHRGYVPEDRVAELFGQSTIVVLPYNSSAGSSGVAHQAAQFGVPIIATDVPDLREMTTAEGLLVEWGPQQDSRRFAEIVADLLLDEPRRQAIASANSTAVQSQTLGRIVEEYLHRFRDYAARSISRRVLPQN
jgi:glycosyltransferase involved in cell wall biosynthesis